MTKKTKRIMKDYSLFIAGIVGITFVLIVEFEATKFLITERTMSAFLIGVLFVWLLILTVLVLRIKER